MPWVELDWVDGEVITENKLDHAQGNADYVREEARFKIAAQMDAGSIIRSSEGQVQLWARLRVVLNGNTWLSSWVEFDQATWFEWRPIPGLPRNVAISGLTLGTAYAMDIQLDMGPTQGGATTRDLARATVFNVEDMGFISFFGEIRFQTQFIVEVRRFTAIITRDFESL